MAISTADKVIKIAKEYLGCKQGDAQMRQLVDTFNKVKPHGETAHYKDPWCAIAWTAWQILAGNTQKEVPMSYNCGEIIRDAKKLGIWIEKDGTKPKKGWAILYDWQDSGAGDDTGSPDHIGLVYDIDDKWIYVIEGNKGEASVCGKRAIQINGRFIRGFVAPKYSTAVAATTAKKTAKAYTPSTPYTGKLPAKTVRKGSKGADVKAVQTFLNWAIKAGLKVDGSCGSKTTNAIKKFQKQYKLKVDGVFGSQSRKKAQEIVNAHKPKPAPKPATGGATKILARAKEYAWPYGTNKSKYAYKTGSAKAAYRAALKKHMGKKAKISQSDCGYFVNTCVRAAGLGKLTVLPGKASQPYPALPNTLKIVHKGKVIPAGTLKPGDIIRYKKKNGHQHALLYYSSGKIAEAQREHAFPAIKKDIKKYNNSKTVKLATLQVIRAK